MLAVASATCTLTMACMLDAKLHEDGTTLLVVMTLGWLACLWFMLITIISTLV